jgi:transposase
VSDAFLHLPNTREAGNLADRFALHMDSYFHFITEPDLEPTNNAAERALRHAVIWRKLSFGTQSAAGGRFVERMLTVIETCRRAGRNAFAWLTGAVRAWLSGRVGPSLLATGG